MYGLTNCSRRFDHGHDIRIIFLFHHNLDRLSFFRGTYQLMVDQQVKARVLESILGHRHSVPRRLRQDSQDTARSRGQTLRFLAIQRMAEAAVGEGQPERPPELIAMARSMVMSGRLGYWLFVGEKR